MPTYQYACTDCREPHEAVQSFTDDALTTCPSCQGRLRKVFSAVGVVFKGSGFYRTDSRSSSTSAAASKPAAKQEASVSAEKSGSASSKTPAASGASAA